MTHPEEGWTDWVHQRGRQTETDGQVGPVVLVRFVFGLEIRPQPVSVSTNPDYSGGIRVIKVCDTIYCVKSHVRLTPNLYNLSVAPQPRPSLCRLFHVRLVHVRRRPPNKFGLRRFQYRRLLYQVLRKRVRPSKPKISKKETFKENPLCIDPLPLLTFMPLK